MSLRIDTEKLRGILTGHGREGKETPSLSGLLYEVPPLPPGRAATQSITEFLVGFPAFQGLSKKEASVLASSMLERSFGDGEIVFDQGSPSTALYLVRIGCVELLRKIAGAEEVLATVGPNEPVGEVALLLDKPPRLVTARSRGPSELLALSRQDFDALGEKSPAASLKVFRGLARLSALRFQRLMEALESGTET